MLAKLEALINEAKTSISNTKEIADIEQLRVHYLGKKGEITSLLKTLGQLPEDQRRELGQAVNQAKEFLQTLIQTQLTQIRQQKTNAQIAKETIDVSLPGRMGQTPGTIHPISRVIERVNTLFTGMGFEVAEGPEIEDDYHNFTALNIPAFHPARAGQDTFYISEDQLLRAHTSTVQVHVMQTQKPPIWVIAPGRVYRRDYDTTHTPMFHQAEGLVIDKGIQFNHLKNMIETFLHRFFEVPLKIRFRPSYFPFTEPSAEVDIIVDNQTHAVEAANQLAPATEWLEVLGCGMVHPNVLRNVGIDPEEYTGFAFGVGLDRLAMLRYEVPDLRQFFINDIRFLQQF